MAINSTIIVRGLTSAHDWTFGSGISNYLQGNMAIAQNIDTRLSSFLNNCFFDLGAGIDWFNLLGSNNQVALNLALQTVILNTLGVTGIQQFSTIITPETRNFSATYKVQTIYSTISSSFVLNTTAGV